MGDIVENPRFETKRTTEGNEFLVFNLPEVVSPGVWIRDPVRREITISLTFQEMWDILEYADPDFGAHLLRASYSSLDEEERRHNTLANF